jgi:hypothetical protein
VIEKPKAHRKDIFEKENAPIAEDLRKMGSKKAKGTGFYV